MRILGGMKALLLLLLVACAPQSAVAAKPVEREPAGTQTPDVLIVILDDIADSDLDVIPTPSLAALAAEGVRFRRAYSHSWCGPTRDSLLRSLWLGRDHGDACAAPTSSSVDFGDLTLAKVFEAQGYSTAYLGKWHGGSNSIGPWPLTANLWGFDETRALRPVGGACQLPGPPLRVDDGVTSQDGTNDSLMQLTALETWWTERAGTPRMAIVCLAAPHGPFAYPPASILPPGYPTPIPGTNRERYEAEVVGADTVIGDMLELVGPDAWVIVLGDNGTPGNAPPAPPGSTDATRPDQDPDQVKLSCYEDGVRVPLIVRAPGKCSAGLETDALVHVVDLLPTLAEVLGYKTQAPIDGVSFMPALVGFAGRNFVYTHHGGTRPDSALIGERWKLLVDQTGAEMLFDLELDPDEESPLAPVGLEADKLRAVRELILDP